MLVYQLLSHERKKMIWEQLELRRRQAYGRQSPPGWQSIANGPSIIGTPPRNGPCRCCEQCHSHRNMMQPNYSWDGDSRFWSPPPNGYYAQGKRYHARKPHTHTHIHLQANRKEDNNVHRHVFFVFVVFDTKMQMIT